MAPSPFTKPRKRCERQSTKLGAAHKAESLRCAAAACAALPNLGVERGTNEGRGLRSDVEQTPEALFGGVVDYCRTALTPRLRVTIAAMTRQCSANLQTEKRKTKRLAPDSVLRAAPLILKNLHT